MTPLPRAFIDLPLAHRGRHDAARGIPENSRAAVEAAVAQGYGIEIDVQESADAQAMVFHDFTLDRMTPARGAVKEQSRRALGALPLTPGNEGIPSLPEILAIVDGRVPLLIEIKDETRGPAEAPRALERAVSAAIQDYAGPVAVMSFNPHAISHMRALSPDTPLGLTTCAFDPGAVPDLSPADRAYLQEIAAFDTIGAVFISHQHTDLEAPRVAALKAQGVPILCWTIRSPREEDKARRIADGITFEGYAAAVP